MKASPPDVAILGGGIAGLTTAWRLTDPEVRDEVGTVTIYQRGARLGGKAASHRGRHGRIEEHGLHVWLGYYDNAFRLIRECYAELDREASDPTCPIRTWRDAFQPAPLIGLEDLHEGDWSTWTAVFPENSLLPGEPLSDSRPPSAVEFLRRSVGLMGAFVRSLGGARADLGAGLALAAARQAEMVTGRLEGVLPALGAVRILSESVQDPLNRAVQTSQGARRLWHLLDLVAAQLRGLIADNLIENGFRSIDHIEYRDWIGSHGASPETRDGALVRGLYDLAFSHRGGDPARTEFPAGLGLFLATKTFFDYRGALFWKMSAGMGDVVIAPLHQALRARGVEFEFFHRVDDLIPTADGSAIQTVGLGRQLDLAPGVDQYDPLTRYGGLPCFGAWPDPGQLATDPGTENLESFWSTWSDAGRVELVQGRDFDELVFAIPVGMARHVTERLAAVSTDWSTMLETVETVGTQSFQLWLGPSEAELGWTRPGSTVTSYVDSYDTWSSMTHLVDAEGWSGDDRPGTIAYFCSSIAQEPSDERHDGDQPRRAHARARASAIDYLENAVSHYWPAAASPDGGFRWELLAGAGPDAGPAAIDTQYVRANVDPSDRYVQALPGTDHARLRPDASGFAHLHLAGDWTDCGLNAGCIEAAVLSGIGAANSILGLPRGARTSGGYLFSRLSPPGRGGGAASMLAAPQLPAVERISCSAADTGWCCHPSPTCALPGPRRWRPAPSCWS